MHHSKIILLVFLMGLMGCGKPPLFNQVKKSFTEVSGGVFLSEQFPKEQIIFTFKWMVAPSLDELSSFEMVLEKPIKESQTLRAYLWMPDMGHGSSPIEIQQTGPQSYIFSELAFIMPGLWVLHVDISENNKVIDQWQRPITL